MPLTSFHTHCLPQRSDIFERIHVVFIFHSDYSQILVQPVAKASKGDQTASCCLLVDVL